MNEINNTFNNFVKTQNSSKSPSQNMPTDQKGNKTKPLTDAVILWSGGTALGGVTGYASFKFKMLKLKADLAQEIDNQKQTLQKAFDENKMVKILKEIIKTSPEGIKNTEKNIQELKDYIEESKKKAVNGKVKIEQYDVEIEEVINKTSKQIKDNAIKKQLLEKNKIEAENKLQSLLNKMVKEPMQDLINQNSLEEKQILKSRILKGTGIGLVLGGIIAIVNYFRNKKANNQ